MTLYTEVEPPAVHRVFGSKRDAAANQDWGSATRPFPRKLSRLDPSSGSSTSPDMVVFEIRPAQEGYEPTTPVGKLDAHTYTQPVKELVRTHSFDFLWEKIARWYSVRDPGRIEDFVHQRPLITKVLADAIDELPKYFGPQPDVVLERVIDPEFEEDDQLFAYIRTSLSADDALKRLERLDEDWFLAKIGQLDGAFNFNLQFV